MQIRVRCGCGKSSCPEWAVVELQGVVQPQASFAGDIRGLHIGRLCSAPSPSSKAPGCTFTVGYHELAGTKVTLKKPLLVLRKKKASGGDREPPTTAAVDVELEVIGVIRHKILFKDRPKALISSNPFSFSTSVDSGFAWNVADSFSRCSSEPPTKEKKTLQSAAA
jgi:chromosome transmission fidelity protein 8